MQFPRHLLTYISPTDLDTALKAMRSCNHCVIAGGTDIYPAMGQGKAPSSFLDVTRIKGLSSITQQDGLLRIGAAATWSDIAKAELPPAFDALKQAALEVGSRQIQNSGTVGGNLCNASPAADGVPPLLALNARVELASAERGVRSLNLSEFIQGVRKTDKAHDELVTAVLIPDPPDSMVSSFEKLGSRRYLVISISMTAANLVLDAHGRIAVARIAVGSCSPTAQRLPDLEADLVGKLPAEAEVPKTHLKPLSPIDDIRGSGAYRLIAAAEQCRRAIQRAAAR